MLYYPTLQVKYHAALGWVSTTKGRNLSLPLSWVLVKMDEAFRKQ